MVEVASFADGITAGLAVLRLQQAGIAARLLDADLLPVEPLLQVAAGGVRLAVAAADAEAARRLLAQHRRQVSVVRGPECGSVAVASTTGVPPG